MNKKMSIVSIFYIIILLLISFVFLPMNNEIRRITEDGGNLIMEREITFLNISKISQTYKGSDHLFVNVEINSTILTMEIVVLTLIYLVIMYLFKPRVKYK